MKAISTHSRLVIVLATLGVIGAALATTASANSRVVVTGDADIRVWVDDTWDVYSSYDDVVISVRAARDCYATVFVVDTEGYVHVVRPLSPWDDAWIRGGRTYRYAGYDLGLAGLRGRGVAHVFAISSPYPFDYTPYGEAIFVGRFGFRVYGDPYVASREIYLSLLPRACRVDYVSVSVARFHIREWARYPRYLCRGHGGVHVRVGDYCRHCSHLYDGYRVHVADPYPVIHPRAKFQRRATQYAELKRSTVKYKDRGRSVRSQSASREASRRESVAGWSRTSAKQQRPTVKQSVRKRAATPRRVASKVISRKSSGSGRKVVTRKTTTRTIASRKATVRTYKPNVQSRSTATRASKAIGKKKGTRRISKTAR